MSGEITPRRIPADAGISSVRLSAADEPEILRYIGYSGQKLDENLKVRIGNIIDRLNRATDPKLTAVVYTCGTDGSWPDALTFLTGEDIKRHLAGCGEILLMGATIGASVDRAIHIEEVKDAVNALIMDSAGSTLIEAVCDSFEASLRSLAAKQSKFLTTRFSPGYGDLPLAVQNRFGELIEARRIGLTITPEHIMVPRKSVTAIIGIADHPLRAKKRTCADCNMHESCRFRKRGVVCGE